MRSKTIRRDSAPPPRGGQRTNQILAVAGLLIVGALVALSAEKLAGTAGTATASATPADSFALDTSPAPSDDASASISPASPILEGQIPKAVNGVTLTTLSATDATNLSNSPNGRAMNAAVIKLGKTAADLELALSYDGSGSLDLSIIGFRVDGVDAATLTPLVLDTWLAANTAGVTSTSVLLSGTTATEVSYGDSGTNEYLIVHGDSVFVIETADQSLAATITAAITGTTGATSSAAPPPSSGVSPAPVP